MPTLAEILLIPERRPLLVSDTIELIKTEVKGQSALVRTVYRIVTAIMPNIVREAVELLLDDIVQELESVYQDYLLAKSHGSASSIEDYISQDGNSQNIAQAILAVTDRRDSRSTKTSLKKAYHKIRPRAENSITAAAPAAARMLHQHGV